MRDRRWDGLASAAVAPAGGLKGSVSFKPSFPIIAPMLKFLPVLLVALLITGCGLLYKQPIYQGSLLKADAIEQLQVGMAKQQVMNLLGTPAIADPFHHQRWDYTATQRVNRKGRTEIKNLILWFENDQLTHWEGEVFPEQDLELSQRMRRFGNLPREKGQGRR